MGPAGVVVAHPGRQHSHETALALYQSGLLAGYWAGIPCRARHSRRVPKAVWNRFVKYAEIALPDELVVWNPVAPVLMKAAGLLGARHARRAELAGYALFDRWVARRLQRVDAAVFVGYETSTLASFRAAKARGMVTVLDAASIHHRAQDRLHGYVESPRAHQQVCDIKDKEIELADVVLTLSDVACESYLEAGVPPAKLKVIALGVDLSHFFPERGSDQRSGPFRFLFVGSKIHRKGIDLLMEAFSTVHRSFSDTELVFVGGGGDAAGIVRDGTGHGVTDLGRMTQHDLANEYRRADCFVLPSRNDSYGMVIAEALACGVPVILSDMVGAKFAVTEGVNGWVLPTGDLASLTSRMGWCAANPEAVRAMRKAASASARSLSWAAYHAQIAAFYGHLCEASGSESATCVG